ncbi:MAG: hypothetical protein ABIJ57_01710 [Pseudomonadota bacterium]
MRRLWTWIKAAWTWATAHRAEIEDVAEDVGEFLGIDKDEIPGQLRALLEKEIRGMQVHPMTICSECYKAGFQTPALAVKEIIIGVGPKALVLQTAECALHEDPDWIDEKRAEWFKLHGGGPVNG